MEFEWDAAKAGRNLAAHGVSFQEAATVFGDPLSLTFIDPDHSEDEDRFLTFGQSSTGQLLVVVHTDRGDRTRIISARLQTRSERRQYERRRIVSDSETLRPEYDLSKLKDGVRGKYLGRYRAGTNLALLAPDVRAAFPDDEAVNRALRSLMKTQPSA